MALLLLGSLPGTNKENIERSRMQRKLGKSSGAIGSNVFLACLWLGEYEKSLDLYESANSIDCNTLI